MTHLTAKEARDDFDALVDRVAAEGERIVLSKGEREIVAIVPMDDLELLEDLEDRLDLLEARKALREFEESGEAGIPIEEFARRLGIDPDSAQ